MTKVDKTGVYPAVKGKKRKMAELLVNPDVELTVTEMCEQVGVSRQTFYNWQKETDFKNYVNFLIESYTDSELPGVWRALIKKAHLGDSQALKLFFELKNKCNRGNDSESERQKILLEAIERAVKGEE